MMQKMSSRLAAILLLPSLLHLLLPPAEAKVHHPGHGSSGTAFYKITLRNTTPNKRLEADCEGVYDPPSPVDSWRRRHFLLPFGRNRRMVFPKELRRSNRLVVTCTFKDLSSGCWAEGVQVFDSGENKCFLIDGGCSFEFRNEGFQEFLFSVEDEQVLGFFPYHRARRFDEPYSPARPLLGKRSACVL